MSLEIITLGQVLRADKESLTPGTVIEGFRDYNNATSLLSNLGSKLKMPGEPSLRVHFASDIAETMFLINNTDFRNRQRFWGTIMPEKALILPADTSLVPSNRRSGIDPDGIAFLLRYGLFSSGRGRLRGYVVECALFHETQRLITVVYVRERRKKVMEKLIGQKWQEYAQSLQEGLDLIFSSPS